MLRKTTIDWAAKESVRAKFCILASESSANTVPESRWWSVNRVMSLGEHDADKARSGQLRATDALASRRFVRMAGPVSAAIRHRVTRQQPVLAAVLQVRNFVPGLSRRKARTFTLMAFATPGESPLRSRQDNRKTSHGHENVATIKEVMPQPGHAINLRTVRCEGNTYASTCRMPRHRCVVRASHVTPSQSELR